MDKIESPNHTKWDCKYHLVFIPKCRKKTLYLKLRKHFGEVLGHWRVKRRARRKRGI
jgi:putative transposase